KAGLMPSYFYAHAPQPVRWRLFCPAIFRCLNICGYIIFTFAARKSADMILAISVFCGRWEVADFSIGLSSRYSNPALSGWGPGVSRTARARSEEGRVGGGGKALLFLCPFSAA